MNKTFGKEAYFYTQTSKGVQCGICPHACNLVEGARGLCQSRINIGGKLYSEAYAQACALHIDPVEKKPLLHFYPASFCLSVAATGCNLACLNCQNWEISQAKPTEVKSVYTPPEKIVDICIENNCHTIAYTYTEPLTFYEYTFDCAELAHRRGLRNILVSAGFVNEAPLRKLAPYIDAANIDLKSFSDDIYKKINRGRLQPVLNTLKTLKSAGVWLEITNLIIPTVNDNFEMIRQMCRWLCDNGFYDSPLHFSRFFPTYKMNTLSPTPLKTLETARNIAVAEGLQYVYIGNVSEMEGENTYCSKCKKLLVRRNGYNILENNIVAGKCPQCGNAIAGKF